MASTFLYTSHKFLITFSIPGVTIDTKPWDKFEGAAHSNDTQNYPAGGIAPSIAVSGVGKREQATLQRAFDDILVASHNAIDAATGQACSIAVKPLKSRGAQPGVGPNFTGIIRTVTGQPAADSTSSTIAMFAVIVELDEDVIWS
jgi:hypothetical protein